MEHGKKILIRLPNWLGDMVFSTAFVKAVNEQYPGAKIDVIAKKGIDVLLDYFPPHHARYLFDKKQYKGLSGAWKFGKEIAAREKYDIFFSLPDSISAAVMGYATGAKVRVGYKKELRSLFLTHSYTRMPNQYHVDAYISLLERFTGNTIPNAKVNMVNVLPVEKNNSVVININSEAQSRKWPREKAISIINTIRENISQEIILVGSPGEKDHVDDVYENLKDKTNVTNLAGKSPLPLLVTLMSNCKMAISSESGPAQISNALGTPTLITLGASSELLSTPQKENNITTIRHGKLPCEPCLKNTCSKFPQPECLMRIDEMQIVEKVRSILEKV